MEQNQLNDKKNNRVLLIVLSLVLGVALGLGGFMLYDSLKDSDKDEVVENQTSQVDSQQPETKEICAEAEKICLDYPADWKADAKQVDWPARDSEMAKDMKEDEFVKTDKVTLVSPDESVQVTVVTGVSGIGFACNAGDNGKTFQVRKKETAITGYKADENNVDKAYAVALVAENKEGTEFTPRVGLTTSKSAVNKNESDGCDTALFSITEGRNIDLDGMKGSVAVGTNGSDFSDTKAKKYSSLEDAKKALETEAYKQAFDIIASARYQ